MVAAGTPFRQGRRPSSHHGCLAEGQHPGDKRSSSLLAPLRHLRQQEREPPVTRPLSSPSPGTLVPAIAGCPWPCHHRVSSSSSLPSLGILVLVPAVAGCPCPRRHWVSSSSSSPSPGVLVLVPAVTGRPRPCRCWVPSSSPSSGALVSASTQRHAFQGDRRPFALGRISVNGHGSQ